MEYLDDSGRPNPTKPKPYVTKPSKSNKSKHKLPKGEPFFDIEQAKLEFSKLPTSLRFLLQDSFDKIIDTQREKQLERNKKLACSTARAILEDNGFEYHPMLEEAVIALYNSNWNKD